MATNALNNITIDEQLFLRTNHDPKDLVEIDLFPGMQFFPKDYQVGKETISHYIAVLGRDDKRLGYSIRVEIDGTMFTFALVQDINYLRDLKRLFKGKVLWMNAYVKSEDDLQDYIDAGEKLAPLFFEGDVSYNQFDNKRGYTISFSRNNSIDFNSLDDILTELSDID